MTALRTLCALALTAAGALALVVAELITRKAGHAPESPKRSSLQAVPPSVRCAPRTTGLAGQAAVTEREPSTRPSLIVEVSGAVAFDVDSYRFVRGGVA